MDSAVGAALEGHDILILTGSASPLQFDAAEKVGAQGVFRKPTRLEDLKELLVNIAAQYCERKEISSRDNEEAAPF